MKIGIYVSSLKGGGAERVMLHLAMGMLEQGHQVVLLLSRYEGDYFKQIPQQLKIIPIKKTGRLKGLWHVIKNTKHGFKWLAHLKLPRFLTRLEGVINYIKEEQPDAIIAALHNSNLSAVMARECLNSNVKIVVTEHIALSSYLDSVPERHKKLLPLIQQLYPLADHRVTVSEGVKKDLSQIAKIPEETITTIFNPVITPEFKQKVQELPDHPWLQSRQDFILLAVGRLSRQKDFANLINAIAIIKDALPLKLIILGEGKERENLTALIKEKGLTDRVDLHGFVENPYAYMAHSDLFVMSSILEGLPTVLIEALAAGCQVVSTDCPFGPKEILKNGQYGTLIPVNDSKALAVAIKKHYKQYDKVKESKEYALQFTLSKAAKAYLKLI